MFDRWAFKRDRRHISYPLELCLVVHAIKSIILDVMAVILQQLNQWQAASMYGCDRLYHNTT